MKNEKKKVTSFETLKQYSDGVVMELPSFSESQPFVCRLKRPSLIDVVTDGSFPNPLLPVALEIFDAKETKKEEKSAEQTFKESKEFDEVLRHVARASMVEPTYEQVEEAGMSLTSAQLIEIYNYANTGVEKLEFFRTESKD